MIREHSPSAALVLIEMEKIRNTRQLKAQLELPVLFKTLLLIRCMYESVRSSGVLRQGQLGQAAQGTLRYLFQKVSALLWVTLLLEHQPDRGLWSAASKHCS